MQMVPVVAWRIEDADLLLSNNSSTWAQRYLCGKTSKVGAVDRGFDVGVSVVVDEVRKVRRQARSLVCLFYLVLDQATLSNVYRREDGV